MLGAGRIPLTPAEHKAADKLIADHPDASVSLTRRDPDETGPLLAHVGEKTWEISQDGKRKKVA